MATKQKPCYLPFSVGSKQYVMAHQIVMMEPCGSKQSRRLRALSKEPSSGVIDLTKGDACLTVIHLEGGKQILCRLSIKKLMSMNEEILNEWQNQKFYPYPPLE